MIELVFATNNANKLLEVSAVLGDKIKLKSLEDIHCVDDIPETGVTFHENALQKSRFIVDKYDMNCFGDDSGLEVEALNNEPGIYSARYSGSRDMEQNMNLLLKKLEGINNRRASFVTVISLILNEKEYFFEGRVYGEIIHAKRGEKGFGYDPVFIPEGYNKTFAEMTDGEKNAISHRAIAVKKLIDFLLSL